MRWQAVKVAAINAVSNVAPAQQQQLATGNNNVSKHATWTLAMALKLCTAPHCAIASNVVFDKDKACSTHCRCLCCWPTNQLNSPATPPPLLPTLTAPLTLPLFASAWHCQIGQSAIAIVTWPTCLPASSSLQPLLLLLFVLLLLLLWQMFAFSFGHNCLKLFWRTVSLSVSPLKPFYVSRFCLLSSVLALQSSVFCCFPAEAKNDL